MSSPITLSVLGVVGTTLAGVPRPTLPYFSQIQHSTDVSRLEHVAGDFTFAEREYRAQQGNTGIKNARQQALLRLGELGTPDSLAAVRRIEAAQRGRSILPPAVVLGALQPHAAPNMSDSSWTTAARVSRADGVEIGAMHLGLYGWNSVFVIRREPGAATWSRPYLVPMPQFSQDFAITLKDLPADRLRIEFAMDPRRAQLQPSPDVVELSLADLTRDSDGDGWTDVEEWELGMSFRSKDSDSDGIADDRDAAPGFREQPRDVTDDTPLLKRAVFAQFGLTEAPHVLFARQGVPRIQPDGLPGPVIYDHAVSGVLVTWKVVSRTETEATVEITDFEGAFAASGEEFRLRKIDGHWFAVSKRLLWIS
jgi:hypothetical protein